MDKVLECVKKEIKQIGEQGINANNIDVLYKLVDIEKDIYKICEKRDEMHLRNREKKMKSHKYMDEHEYEKSYKKIHDHKFIRYMDNLIDDFEEYQYMKENYDDDLEKEFKTLTQSYYEFIEYMCHTTDDYKEKEMIEHYLEKIK